MPDFIPKFDPSWWLQEFPVKVGLPHPDLSRYIYLTRLEAWLGVAISVSLAALFAAWSLHRFGWRVEIWD